MPPRAVTRPNRVWPASRYIDYDNGDDASSGRDPYAPWKHCPGDPAATGAAAAMAASIPVGTIFQFAAGVVYRGRIDAKASGTLAAPIQYLGRGWGEGAAIIAGADVFTCAAHSCAGDASVPSAVRSDQFLVIDLPSGKIPEAWNIIKLNGDYLEFSQYPLPPDFWRWDDSGLWLVDPSAIRTKGGSADVNQKYDLTLKSDRVLTALSGDPAYDLGFRSYGYPNAIFAPSHCTYDAGTNTITGQGMLGLTNESGGAGESSVNDPFALTNHPRFLIQAGARAGMYCSIDNGTRLIVRRSVAAPFSGAVTLEFSTRTRGFDFKVFSNILFRGFELREQAGPSGVQPQSISSSVGAAVNQDVDDVWVHHIKGVSSDCQAIVNKGLLQRFLVEDCWEARGVTGQRVMDGEAKNLNYTGLSYNGGFSDVRIDRIRITDVQSVHGNGASFYLANSNMQIWNSTIFGSPRPFTFRGGSGLKWIRSVFAGGGESGYSYGSLSQGGVRNWEPSDGPEFESCVLLSSNGNDGLWITGSPDVKMRKCIVQGLYLYTATIGGITYVPTMAEMTGNLFLDATGFSASGGNTLDTSPATLAKAQAFARFTPVYDDALIAILRGDDDDPDFYVGCPDWSLVTAPVKASDPAISKSGNVLTVVPGMCAQNKYNSRDYQWFKDGVGIVGATTLSYDTAGVSGVYSVRERHHNIKASLTLTASRTI